MLLPLFYKFPRFTIFLDKTWQTQPSFPEKPGPLSLDFVFGLAVRPQGLSTIIVGNSEDARSPTQLCLFWLLSPPPTRRSWLRLWSVWEKRQESLWLSHDPGLAHATKPGPLVYGLNPWHSGFEGGEIPASFPLVALVLEEGKGLEFLLVTGDEWAMQTRGLIASTSPLRPPPEMFFGQTKSQDSQKTQLTQSQEQLPPPWRHSPPPKAYPEDLVRKLKNSWVCGDKPCGFAL